MPGYQHDQLHEALAGLADAEQMRRQHAKEASLAASDAHEARVIAAAEAETAESEPEDAGGPA